MDLLPGNVLALLLADRHGLLQEQVVPLLRQGHRRLAVHPVLRLVGSILIPNDSIHRT